MPAQGWACGFIESSALIRTLCEDAAQAELILFVNVTNAREGPGEGSSDLVIKRILKGKSLLAGKKVFSVSRYVRIEASKKPPQYLVFAERYKGKIDPYKGLPCSSALLDYVRGLLAIDAGDRKALMRYCFDYLEHADQAIGNDAIGVFLKSTDPDIRTVARGLSAAKLRRLVQAERTSPERLRLYGYLLGNCGEEKDAALLRQVLDRLRKQSQPPLVDGILTGYTLLDARGGWAYTKGLLKDSGTDFRLRYSALRAARYFWTTHSGIVTEKDLLGAVSLSLSQSDIADISIEYLRKWRCWKFTGKILALFDKKDFEVPVIRHSIVRYALQCPDARADRFLKKLRKTNPALIEGAQELLKGEQQSAAPNRGRGSGG
jgi:hypothetical protein